jgi:hypothetical protein
MKWIKHPIFFQVECDGSYIRTTPQRLPNKVDTMVLQRDGTPLAFVISGSMGLLTEM